MMCALTTSMRYVVLDEYIGIDFLYVTPWCGYRMVYLLLKYYSWIYLAINIFYQIKLAGWTAITLSHWLIVHIH